MKRISQPELLNAVFDNVYSTKFHAELIDDRVMMQKAVFIMREKGISCGNYEFVWDQYGPFSPELSDDMKKAVDAEKPPIQFNQEALTIMAALKDAFSQDTVYTVRDWAEAIASLLYLKKYIYPSYTDEQLIKELEIRKANLRQHEENCKAMTALKEILAI